MTADHLVKPNWKALFRYPYRTPGVRDPSCFSPKTSDFLSKSHLVRINCTGNASRGLCRRSVSLIRWGKLYFEVSERVMTSIVKVELNRKSTLLVVPSEKLGYKFIVFLVQN